MQGVCHTAYAAEEALHNILLGTGSHVDEGHRLSALRAVPGQQK